MEARTLHHRYSHHPPAPPHRWCWRRSVVVVVVGCASGRTPLESGADSATVGAAGRLEPATADTGLRRPAVGRMTSCNWCIAASEPLRRPMVDTGGRKIQRVRRPGRCLFGRVGRHRLGSWGYRVTSKAAVAIVVLPRLDTMTFHRRLIEVSTAFSSFYNRLNSQVNPRPYGPLPEVAGLVRLLS